MVVAEYIYMVPCGVFCRAVDIEFYRLLRQWHLNQLEQQLCTSIYRVFRDVLMFCTRTAPVVGKTWGRF